MVTINKESIQNSVRQGLHEDLGTGDITAQLIPADNTALAHIICREAAIICGQPWFNEVFRQLDPTIDIQWLVNEGDWAKAGQPLVQLQGNSRSLLTGERTAMNFLQLLSGTATLCHDYASLVKDYKVKLLDTRKTIPGLRQAQKYAVTTGGCHNHRMGLYDAFLIKENHIAACGGIAQAIKTARETAPDKPVEIEVENIEEFRQAQHCGADIIMLDNFSIDLLKETVTLNKSLESTSLLEASGGVTQDTLKDIAATGVDYISIGALTKDCKAIDLSMRII